VKPGVAMEVATCSFVALELALSEPSRRIHSTLTSMLSVCYSLYYSPPHYCTGSPTQHTRIGRGASQVKRDKQFTAVNVRGDKPLKRTSIEDQSCGALLPDNQTPQCTQHTSLVEPWGFEAQ
jgi:hypothetical protein